MEMNSIYKSHTVGNMRNTYVHGNKQTIRLGIMDVQVFSIYNEIAYCHQLYIYEFICFLVIFHPPIHPLKPTCVHLSLLSGSILGFRVYSSNKSIFYHWKLIEIFF
jgi:hypothetical protein